MIITLLEQSFVTLINLKARTEVLKEHIDVLSHFVIKSCTLICMCVYVYLLYIYNIYTYIYYKHIYMRIYINLYVYIYIYIYMFMI